MTPGAGPRLPSIGLRVAQYGGDWPTLRDLALRAEQRGFHSLWVNDHLPTPGRLVDQPAFDAFSTLAALAALTRRARLGVAVLSSSYRPAPLAAKMATVIDVISAGRLTIGLGTGSDRAEHAAYGFPFDDARTRTERAEAAFATMRAMMSRPRAATTETGLRDAQNLPAPIQTPPPIWIAANGPRLLRFAGGNADGIVVAFAEPDGVAQRLAVAREARGSERPELSCALYTYVLPYPSATEVHRWLAPECERLGTTPERLVRWLDGTGLVGDPASLRERLDAHRRAGVTDAVLVLPNGVPAEALDALADACLEPAAASEWPSTRRPEANLVDLLIERHRREGRGADAAVIEGDAVLDFDGLSEQSARAAGALRARGVREGDRVVVALRDGIGWVGAFCGAVRLGAVAVPLDPGAPPEVLAAVLDDCRPALAVAEPDLALPSDVARCAADELDGAAPARVCAVDPGDLAYLVYSSGSTGRPKAAMHAHVDPKVSVETYATEVLDLGPGDRCLSVARLFTSLGFGNGFFRPLGKGAAIILSPARPTVRSVLRDAEHHGVSVLTGVPTFWAQLVQFLDRHPVEDPLAAVRLLVSSGDSLPAPVAEAVAERIGVDLVEGLGCSECSNTIISWRPGEHLPGRLGRVVDGVEIRLADGDGAPVPAGSPGRLWIKSDSNTTGYWRRPELTRELVYGPWLRMGDVLREEEPGIYRYVGRSDDLFKVDAQWVSPSEVEACLLEHDAVREAAVVGTTDDRGLTRPAAFVVAAGPPPERVADELRRHVADRLRPQAAPTEVHLLEELPRLPSGKLDRRALRQRLEPAD